MRELQRFGVEEFLLLAGPSSQTIETVVEQIRPYLPKPAKITISLEPCPAGSGGALYHARQHLQERFLLCHGETLFSCNLARFLAHARSGNWMLLHPAERSDQEGTVYLAEDGQHITSFSSSGEHGPTPLLNSGIYLFDHSIFQHLTGNCSLEQDVLPTLVRYRDLKGLSLPSDIHDLSVPANLVLAENDVPKRLRRPAVFLDRDGVINRDHGWVGTRERFEWEPDVLETIAQMTDSGHHVFIVTNQSGVARGLYTEDDLKQLMDWVIETIREHGGTIDDWRYCPMHPEAVVEQYRGQSPDRKPAPGMILDLITRWELDPARCVMFGDQPTDIQAADAAGIKGIRVGPSTLAELASHRGSFQ